jgi:mRNA interferase RelE/StbE
VNYRILIPNRTRKELDAIPASDIERVSERISSLGVNPRPPGCKKLKDEDKTWRVRVGKYRILFQIDDAAKAVVIVAVGHRKEIYR